MAYASQGAEENHVLQNPHLRVTVRPKLGAIEVYDKRARRIWTQPEPTGRPDRNPFKNVQAGNNVLTFQTRSGGLDVRVAVTLDARKPELLVVTAAERPEARFGGGFSLDVLLPPYPDANIAIADYSNGHLYPITLKDFPATWFAGDRLNMPWVGVCQGTRGPGYLLLLETSDDSCVELQQVKVGTADVRLPRIGWLPSKGTFAYRRRLRVVFVSAGGYVALARAYREHARAQGLLVTLREKAARNPNVRRLYGAVDVWGDASLKFAQAARDAGVQRMIIHGRTSPEEMRRINDLGFLTSEYDNYTDILPVAEGQSPDSQHDFLPGAAVLKADGKRMEAWLTYDRKTQYMKRCPALWVPRAREVIRKVLALFPFLGRFIDVTTAEALYECYDPDHPLDKAAKRKCGEELLRTVRDMGLVVGGEHGIWWGVPYLCYIEGMMSSYQFAWPAGHLIRPKSKSETFEGPYGTQSWDKYERLGIGHQYRVPLWELVFHDCVVSTWYWGDSNDFLIAAAPEYTRKKQVFNVLYGTIPILWADKNGSWTTDRSVFIETVQTVCPVAAAVAEAAMTDHEFLSPDRAVQRTRFSNGVTCVVNFGSQLYTVRLKSKTYTLGQYGYVVYGRRFLRARYLQDGREVIAP